jgi:hypothetical protein
MPTQRAVVGYCQPKRVALESGVDSVSVLVIRSQFVEVHAQYPVTRGGALSVSADEITLSESAFVRCALFPIESSVGGGADLDCHRLRARFVCGRSCRVGAGQFLATAPRIPVAGASPDVRANDTAVENCGGAGDGEEAGIWVRKCFATFRAANATACETDCNRGHGSALAVGEGSFSIAYATIENCTGLSIVALNGVAKALIRDSNFVLCRPGEAVLAVSQSILALEKCFFQGEAPRLSVVGETSSVTTDSEADDAASGSGSLIRAWKSVPSHWYCVLGPCESRGAGRPLGFSAQPWELARSKTVSEALGVAACWPPPIPSSESESNDSMYGSLDSASDDDMDTQVAFPTHDFAPSMASLSFLAHRSMLTVLYSATDAVGFAGSISVGPVTQFASPSSRLPLSSAPQSQTAATEADPPVASVLASSGRTSTFLRSPSPQTATVKTVSRSKSRSSAFPDSAAFHRSSAFLESAFHSQILSSAFTFCVALSILHSLGAPDGGSNSGTKGLSGAAIGGIAGGATAVVACGVAFAIMRWRRQFESTYYVVDPPEPDMLSLRFSLGDLTIDGVNNLITQNQPNSMRSQGGAFELWKDTVDQTVNDDTAW